VGKLTSEVFAESCCDGGACSTEYESARPCGCDPGAKWVCEQHRSKTDCPECHVPEGSYHQPTCTRLPPGFVKGLAKEVRVVDPVTGGEKGTKLARFSLIPPEFLWALAEHYGRGSLKYADRNWEKGYKWSLSVDALERHLTQMKQGEMVDEETGSLHITAVAWHAAALFTFITRGIGTDDVTRKVRF
jgi:hypothetical protein